MAHNFLEHANPVLNMQRQALKHLEQNKVIVKVNFAANLARQRGLKHVACQMKAAFCHEQKMKTKLSIKIQSC